MFNLLILININRILVLLYLSYYNEIIHENIHTICYSTYIKSITYLK